MALIPSLSTRWRGRPGDPCRRRPEPLAAAEGAGLLGHRRQPEAAALLRVSRVLPQRVRPAQLAVSQQRHPGVAATVRPRACLLQGSLRLVRIIHNKKSKTSKISLEAYFLTPSLFGNDVDTFRVSKKKKLTQIYFDINVFFHS